MPMRNKQPTPVSAAIAIAHVAAQVVAEAPAVRRVLARVVCTLIQYGVGASVQFRCGEVRALMPADMQVGDLASTPPPTPGPLSLLLILLLLCWLWKQQTIEAPPPYKYLTRTAAKG
eukprot:365911-Chlamydomonas_euryale.AAC.9